MSEEQLLGRHRAVMPSWLTLYYEQPGGGHPPV